MKVFLRNPQTVMSDDFFFLKQMMPVEETLNVSVMEHLAAVEICVLAGSASPPSLFKMEHPSFRRAALWLMR